MMSSFTRCQRDTACAPASDRFRLTVRRSPSLSAPGVRVTYPADCSPPSRVATELGASRSIRASWPGLIPGCSVMQESSSSWATERPRAGSAARAARRMARRSRDTISANSGPICSPPDLIRAFINRAGLLWAGLTWAWLNTRLLR